MKINLEELQGIELEELNIKEIEERERASCLGTYSVFISRKLNLDLGSLIEALEGLDYVSTKVHYLYLLEHAEEDVVVLSRKDVMDGTGYSNTTVTHNYQKLVELGYVKKIFDRKGFAPIYKITPLEKLLEK